MPTLPSRAREGIRERACQEFASIPSEWGQSMRPARQPLRRFTPPDGLVLDPFCGAGTFSIAAVAEVRRAVGIELDQGHAEVATRRLAKSASRRGDDLRAGLSARVSTDDKGQDPEVQLGPKREMAAAPLVNSGIRGLGLCLGPSWLSPLAPTP
jgi:hypothetical protein